VRGPSRATWNTRGISSAEGEGHSGSPHFINLGESETDIAETWQTEALYPGLDEGGRSSSEKGEDVKKESTHVTAREEGARASSSSTTTGGKRLRDTAALYRERELKKRGGSFRYKT